MTEKVKLADAEAVFKNLAKALGKESAWVLHSQNHRVRVEQPYTDGSGAVHLPYGRTWYTYAEFYQVVWFALDTLRIIDDTKREDKS